MTVDVVLSRVIFLASVVLLASCVESDKSGDGRLESVGAEDSGEISPGLQEPQSPAVTLETEWLDPSLCRIEEFSEWRNGSRRTANADGVHGCRPLRRRAAASGRPPDRLMLRSRDFRDTRYRTTALYT